MPESYGQPTAAAPSSFFARGRVDPLLWICAAFALLVAWQRQPRFYHAEPVIALYRYLDPDFLPNDFFANTLDGYHYQYFFTLLNGAVVRLTGVAPEVVLSAIAYLSVLGIPLSVAYAGYLLSRGSARAAVVSSVFVATSLFALGGLGPYLPFARPWALVQPMVVAAMALVCVRRPVAAAVWLGIGSLFHPLIGGVMGVICLGAAWLDHVVSTPRGAWWGHFLPGRMIAAGVIFLVFLSPNILFTFESWGAFRMPGRDFVEITIYYRHPQHFLMEFWQVRDIVSFVFSVLAAALAFLHPKVRKIATRPMWLIGVALFVLVLSGYLLIEVFPTRLGGSLMAYRFSIDIHYLLVLLAGRFAYVHCRPGSPFSERSWCYLMVLAFIGIGEGYAVFVVFAGGLIGVRTEKRAAVVTVTTLAALVGIASVDGLANGSLDWLHLAAAVALVGAIEATYLLPARLVHVGAAMATVGLLVIGSRDAILAPDVSAAREAPEYEMARAAEDLTPEGALFVAPPGLELIRTVGHRALVVGYEFPFLDEYIVGWYDRAKTVWGPEPLYYEEAVERYKRIPDFQLSAAREKFGATHAVLFRETSTDFPKIYENGKYKIVRLR